MIKPDFSKLSDFNFTRDFIAYYVVAIFEKSFVLNQYCSIVGTSVDNVMAGDEFVSEKPETGKLITLKMYSEIDNEPVSVQIIIPEYTINILATSSEDIIVDFANKSVEHLYSMLNKRLFKGIEERKYDA